MESLFTILLGLGIVFGFWYASRQRRRKSDHARRYAISIAVADQEAEAQVEQAEWEQLIDKQEQARADLVAFVAQHDRTLRTKERQLAYNDDYGRIDISAFNKELEYFVKNVVPADIREIYVSIYDQDATLIMIATVQSCLFSPDQVTEPGAQTYDVAMPGVQFERLVAERLVNAGANVRFTPATGDQGADLIVEHQGETIVVQCKRSASTVGNKAVQEAFAGRKFHDAGQAWVVSNAPFSRAARQLASSLAVRLVDFDQVEAEL